MVPLAYPGSILAPVSRIGIATWEKKAQAEMMIKDKRRMVKSEKSGYMNLDIRLLFIVTDYNIKSIAIYNHHQQSFNSFAILQLLDPASNYLFKI